MDKRQQLIHTALTLFYAHGIHAIGINEILKESGIAKKTLYHHFASKEALVVAALEERNQRFLTWLNSHLEKGKNDWDVVEKLFSALSDWFLDKAEELGHFRGCFFINTSAEYGDPNSAINQRCQQHKQDVQALIQRHLPNTQADTVEAICLLKEGAISSAYVSRDTNAAKVSLAIVRTLLNTQTSDEKS